MVAYLDEFSQHSLFHALGHGILLENLRSTNSHDLIAEATDSIADYLGLAVILC